MNKTIKLLEVFNSTIPNKLCNLADLPIRPCERVSFPSASLSTCWNFVFNADQRTYVKSRINQLVADYESKID